jgi:hypothetical protein
MKKLGIALLTILAMSMMLGTALAQNVGDNSVYFVTYFSNNVAAAPDETVRIINDGDSGGNLWAAFYVFNSGQELTECCACVVSADGILSESVKTQLTANPITSVVPKVGVLKIISSGSDDPTNVTPAAGLRGTATHVQAASKTAYAITETKLADSNLTSTEQSTLQNLCYYDGQLSGQPCTCTTEGQDF